jgi:hypothetical protein
MMTRNRFALAVAVLLALSAEAFAQFGPPVVGMPVVIPNGIDFKFKSGGLRVRGFIPTGGATTAVLPVVPGAVGPGFIAPATYYPVYPYSPYYYQMPVMGAVEQRISVTVMPPASVMARPEMPDIAGIDLDHEPASKIWGEKPALAKKPPVKPVEVAAAPEPAPEKKAPPPEAFKAPPPAKAEPIPEGRRLTDLGVAAFRDGEYGLAILRFRNAGDAAPLAPHPLFFEAQAHIAVGKYREATDLIQQGLKRMPDWPTSGFRPRADLYAGADDVWIAHRKQLKAAHLARPKDADFLFLLGYLAWFDGQRDTAIDYFDDARAVADDPRYSDLFLKAAAAKK